jgi:Holliday junction resolvasome RuvABC endonuclease subunit
MAKKITKAQQQKMDDKLHRSNLIKISRRDIKLNIVAFDQATKCGVAFQMVGEQPEVQLWDMALKSKESQGMKWIRFESKVRELLKSKKIKVLAYELPAGRNINPIIHSSKMICILEKTCSELDIEYVEFSAGEVKKFATGSGAAGKPLMIEYAKKLWGYEGEDDNEADALHILHLLKSKIN